MLQQKTENAGIFSVAQQNNYMTHVGFGHLHESLEDCHCSRWGLASGAGTS